MTRVSNLFKVPASTREGGIRWETADTGKVRHHLVAHLMFSFAWSHKFLIGSNFINKYANNFLLYQIKKNWDLIIFGVCPAPSGFGFFLNSL